jgi:fructokinase
LRRRAGDDASSTCSFHAHCAEGLASGTAIARRLGKSGTLAEAPELAALVGAYLGDLAAMLVLAWAPHRIVFGGGVMATPGLRARIAAGMHETLGGYRPAVAQGADYLAAPHFADSGLEGALLLARAAAAA